MITTYVHVWVKPEYIQDFINASIENHNESVKEPGNIRFDITQSTSEPSKFVLYEAYIDEDSAGNHKKTAHYLKWKEKVAHMMAKPREGIKHRILAPE